MLLRPLICGEWDGSSVWLQWTPVDAEGNTAYEVNLRFRRSEQEEWKDDWMPVIPRQGSKSHWAVIPVWRERWFCQARVRAVDGEWETAAEVTFSKCTALFEISTSKYDQHFQAGALFHCQVDAAACSYRLNEELEVKPGAPARVTMEAVGESGYYQLDHPGHFELRPAFGVVVVNLEASKEDVQETGRDFTELKAKADHGAITMAVTPRRQF